MGLVDTASDARARKRPQDSTIGVGATAATRSRRDRFASGKEGRSPDSGAALYHDAHAPPPVATRVG